MSHYHFLILQWNKWELNYFWEALARIFELPHTGVINREDYKKSSVPAAEQKLVRHAKLPLVHFFFLNFSSQYCCIKCEGTVTTEKVNSILKEWQRAWTLQGSIYMERKLRECRGFHLLLRLLNSRRSNSFSNETHALPITVVPSS